MSQVVGVDQARGERGREQGDAFQRGSDRAGPAPGALASGLRSPGDLRSPPAQTPSCPFPPC